MISETILSRKGAVRAADVPQAVRDLLDAGTIESVNLIEWLLVDHELLAGVVLPDLGLGSALPQLAARLDALPKRSALRDSQVVADVLADAVPSAEAHARLVQLLAAHPSDSVRGWGATLVGIGAELPLAAKLELIRPFATDAHFGVRELAWMAVRPAVAAELDAALRLLEPWVHASDANARRFASELTRPRGVWCSHLQRLKAEPEAALALLEPLRADPSKYVRDSVANWLNDASKTRPAGVVSVCARWCTESDTPETRSIATRALRTVRSASGSNA